MGKRRTSRTKDQCGFWGRGEALHRVLFIPIHPGEREFWVLGSGFWGGLQAPLSLARVLPHCCCSCCWVGQWSGHGQTPEALLLVCGSERGETPLPSPFLLYLYPCYILTHPHGNI